MGSEPRQCLVAAMDLRRRRRRLDRSKGLENPVMVFGVSWHQPGISRSELDQLSFEVQLGSALDDIPDRLILAPRRAHRLTAWLRLPEAQ